MLNKISELFTVFTREITFIFMGSSLYVFLTNGADAHLDLHYVLGIFLIGIIGTAEYVPFISDREISGRRFIAFRILYVLFVNIVVIVIGFLFRWIRPDNLISLAGFEATFIIISVAIFVASYISNFRQTEKMNELLRKRNQENGM